MPDTSFPICTTGSFQYIDEGPSTDLPPVVLLHGMLGDLSNWDASIRALAGHQYRVLVPVLPVYDMPLNQTHVTGLVDYVRGFIQALNLECAVLVGNSLGGHVALLYAYTYASDVPALVLSGASGIYEVTIGQTTPRRQDREFIRERAAVTFYDPVHVSEDLIDEMYDIVNNRSRALRLIRMARSAKKETVTDHLDEIDTPTLLVWGRNDTITPPDVAQEFLDRMGNARLKFIEECGHAPMIEHPATFNRLMLEFLEDVVRTPTLSASSAP